MTIELLFVNWVFAIELFEKIRFVTGDRTANSLWWLLPSDSEYRNGTTKDKVLKFLMDDIIDLADRIGHDENDVRLPVVKGKVITYTDQRGNHYTLDLGREPHRTGRSAKLTVVFADEPFDLEDINWVGVAILTKQITGDESDSVPVETYFAACENLANRIRDDFVRAVLREYESRPFPERDESRPIRHEVAALDLEASASPTEPPRVAEPSPRLEVTARIDALFGGFDDDPRDAPTAPPEEPGQ